MKRAVFKYTERVQTSYEITHVFMKNIRLVNAGLVKSSTLIEIMSTLSHGSPHEAIPSAHGHS